MTDFEKWKEELNEAFRAFVDGFMMKGPTRNWQSEEDLRQWFAGLAMHALISRGANIEHPDKIHGAALAHADEMVSLLKRGRP